VVEGPDPNEFLKPFHAEPWPAFLVQCLVTAGVVFLAVNASRKPRKNWLSTLLWGIVFGYFVELLNVIGKDPIYKYPTEAPVSWFHALSVWPVVSLWTVPLWVPVGWGGILYASTWTAQRLQSSHWLRAVTAAGLAVNLDLTLDPVANVFKFWQWRHYEVNFCQIPFDNYLGWFLVVLVYAFCARQFIRQLSDNGERSGWVDFFVGGAAAAGAFVVYLALKTGLAGSGAYHNNADGSYAAIIFFVVALVTAFLTWVHAFRSRTNNPIETAIVFVPVVLQVLWLIMLLGFNHWREQPVLLVAIPANLTLGFFLFAWPSLHKFMNPLLENAPDSDLAPKPGGPDSKHPGGGNDAQPAQA
jgi:uncharacterized membrane protein